MNNIELYDKRFDWLVAALIPVTLIWLFYGFDAAFISLLIFALLGALKPAIRVLGSRLAAGVFAAGTILLLSPLLRYVSYDGYCFDGAWSVAVGVSRFQMPDICDRGLLAHLAQGLWVGPLRDLAMPVAGVATMILAWLGRQSSPVEVDPHDAPLSPSRTRSARLLRWTALVAPLLAWGLATAQNHRAQQEVIELERQRRITAEILEAAAAAEEARRIAAEAAAKRVDREWLIDGWAPLDGLTSDRKSNPELYCATDTGYTFETDGRYSTYGEEGKFSLNGNQLALTERSSFEMGEPELSSTPLEPDNLAVERSGEKLIIDGSTYGRC